MKKLILHQLNKCTDVRVLGVKHLFLYFKSNVNYVNVTVVYICLAIIYRECLCNLVLPLFFGRIWHFIM